VGEGVLFEANHSFFVGLDEERPFRVGWLEEPGRLVIDIVTETAAPDPPKEDPEPTTEDTDEKEDVPVGGVDTGFGGPRGVAETTRRRTS
jgi:hypothetical protein